MKAKRDRSKQQLYVIGSDEMPAIKIGISGNPEARCRDLQTGSPFALRVLHTQSVSDADAAEAIVHRVLRSHRIHGEWFGVAYEAALEAIAAALLMLNDSGESNGVPWLAPEGQCPACDRRREAGREAVRRSRARANERAAR